MGVSTWACTDWHLDHDRQLASGLRALEMRPDNAPLSLPSSGSAPVGVHMAITADRLWPREKRSLQVSFLGGAPWQHELVAETAAEWATHTDVAFAFGSADPDAEIRVAFEPNGLSYSQIGVNALEIAHGQHTMNLGWIDSDHSPEELRGVILHEFGHALGCVHEHQSPAARIPWDRDAVYAWYAGPPNKWDRTKVDGNIFATYDQSQTLFSEFDARSVMLYPVQEEFTVGDFAIAPNNSLSEQDKRFIATAYAHELKTTSLQLGAESVASIGMPGQEDEYSITIKDDGAYILQTGGPTNVALAIYGPDSPSRLVAFDNDSGRDGYNARLRNLLIRGEYRLRVSHQAGSGGEYAISIRPAE